jgi:PilZ domain
MPEQRRSPRAPMTVECTLHRRSGSPIQARTLDVGPGGMCVTCSRPLSADEVLHFDLPLADGAVVDGEARVLREQGYHVYALRFEALPAATSARLARVAA